MSTIKELEAEKSRIEDEIKEQVLAADEPAWMPFLRKRLPGFGRVSANGFTCDGCDTVIYGGHHFLSVNARWDNRSLHIYKMIVEMLEAAKAGELEGWPQ